MPSGSKQVRDEEENSIRTPAKLGFSFFVLVLAINLYHHAMWFDELQAWSYTRAAPNPWALVKGLTPEGHPALWYLVLWLPTRLTSNPHVMQGVVFITGAISYYLLWLRSPFTTIEKFMLSTSYQIGFLYSVLSRGYSLGMMILFLFLAGFPHKERVWMGWLLLGLLANVHLYFAMLSVVLALYWILAEESPVRPLERSFSLYLTSVFFSALVMLSFVAENQSTALYLTVVVVPIALLGLVLWASSHLVARVMNLSYILLTAFVAGLAALTTLLPETTLARDGTRVASSIGALGQGLLPLHNYTKSYYWEASMSNIISVPLFFTALGLVGYLLRKSATSLPLLLLQASMMLVVFIARQPGLDWHAGILFLTLVSFLWVDPKSYPTTKSARVTLLVFLTIPALSGLHANINSKIHPLSGSPTTARWLLEHQDSVDTIIANRMFPTISVATMMQQELYFPEVRKEIAHLHWGVWVRRSKVPKIVADRMAACHAETAFFLHPVGDISRMEKHLKEYENLRIEQKYEVGDGLIENYVIYRLRLVKTP